MDDLRLIFVGGPGTGKTTAANKLGGSLGIPVYHTDNLIRTHDWGSASSETARWFSRKGSWIVEGVATVRAIRKWLSINPYGMLPGRVVLFKLALDRQKAGERAMNKGVDTVWGGICGSVGQRIEIVALSTVLAMSRS